MDCKCLQKSKSVVFVRVAKKFSDDVLPRDLMPPFFLMQVIELVKKSVQVETRLFDMGVKDFLMENIVQEIAVNNSQLVVISFDSTCISKSIELCHEIKRKQEGVVCIAVGHAATYCAHQVCFKNSPIDYAVRGEYQCILSEVIEAELKTSGAIDQYVERRDAYSAGSEDLSLLHIIEDVDALPLVPKTRQEMDAYYNVTPVPCKKKLIWGRIFASYGCPNECIFCTQTVRLTYGKVYRQRRVDEIIEDVLRVQQEGANIIEFMDDNFTSSRDHVFEMCEEMIKNNIRIPWGAHVRVDDVDYEMLEFMRAAGCVFMRSGIESGSEDVLGKMKKTKQPSFWKGQVREFFKWAKDLGLCTIAYVVLGGPGEEKQDALLTKELVFSVDPDVVKIHSFCAYPGSEIFDMNTQDYSSEKFSDASHHGFFRFREDAKEWEGVEKDFIRSFYFRPKYIAKHIWKFFGFYCWNLKSTRILFKYVRKITQQCFLTNGAD